MARATTALRMTFNIPKLLQLRAHGDVATSRSGTRTVINFSSAKVSYVVWRAQ